MTKFEEELRNKGVEIFTHMDGCTISKKVCINYADVVNLSEGWVSPEEHQARVDELIEAKEKYTKLLYENSSLKSQLQQQALPVVPECVGEWIEILKTKGLKPLKNHENILVFYKNLPVYNPQFEAGVAYKTTSSVNSSNYGTQNESTVTINDGFRYPLTIQEFNYDTETFHPTQKPVALFEYLIKTYTNKGDTVLDNCMGSGTTAIASINTERNFIGFETNEEYYNKSLQRIKNNVTQLDLFEDIAE